MRFTLIDKILDVKLGESIKASKSLSLAEEYLDDHFPLFPVMPGVLMLEAMTQACAWLIRISENYAHSIVLLKEARNVKYAEFVEPGQTLIVDANVLKSDDRTTQFKVVGSVDGATAVSARLILERYNFETEIPHRKELDGYTINELKNLFTLLCPDFESIVAKQNQLVTEQ